MKVSNDMLLGFGIIVVAAAALYFLLPNLSVYREQQKEQQQVSAVQEELGGKPWLVQKVWTPDEVPEDVKQFLLEGYPQYAAPLTQAEKEVYPYLTGSTQYGRVVEVSPTTVGKEQDRYLMVEILGNNETGWNAITGTANTTEAAKEAWAGYFSGVIKK